MADRFFDTSAAVKHYRAEVGTVKVDAFLNEATSRHFISTLTIVEIHSTLARLVRTGHITSTDFHLTRGRVLGDISAGLWNVLPLSTAHFQHAQNLLLQYGMVNSLRSLDALQLAAVIWNSIGTINTFVCADANLCLIAAAEGIAVVNPELP